MLEYGKYGINLTQDGYYIHSVSPTGNNHYLVVVKPKTAQEHVEDQLAKLQKQLDDLQGEARGCCKDRCKDCPRGGHETF